MSAVALARVVQEAIVEALVSTEVGILNGVKNWDEYQRLCGKRQGLQQAQTILEEETDRMNNQE